MTTKSTRGQDPFEMLLDGDFDGIVDPIDMKANPFHGDNGRFVEGGGGGGSSSSSGGESYNDKIEGTQKEADREVKLANNAVAKASKKLKAEEAKSTTSPKVQALRKKLASTKTTISVESKKLAASGDRIAALKAKLAALKAMTQTDIVKQIDGELKKMKAATIKIADAIASLEAAAK